MNLIKAICLSAAVAIGAIAATAQTFTVTLKTGTTLVYNSAAVDSICFNPVTKPVEIAEPKVGDFYYSDGTWSTRLNSSKSVVGVVFWTGDPTAEDAALRRDHPECTHGLVVSAYFDKTPVAWQAGIEQFNSTTGPWIEANAPEYVSPVSVWLKDTRRNVIAGYNNTRALEAFSAAKENAAWPITVLDAVKSYSAKHPAPETSSGWFLPAVKELTLLINTDYDGDVFDFNNKAQDKCRINLPEINKRLAMVYSTEPLDDKTWAFDLWSSTDFDNISAYQVSPSSGTVMGSMKNFTNNQLVRCVLAF